MVNKPAHPTAATTTPTVVNRISSYDFTARKFSKPPIGTSEKIHLIVAVEPTTKPRKYTGENALHLRRLHWAPGMSLYRAYFVPGAVDPNGKILVPLVCATACIGAAFCIEPFISTCRHRCDPMACVKEIWDATPLYGQIVCGGAVLGCAACIFKYTKDLVSKCRPKPPVRPPVKPPVNPPPRVPPKKPCRTPCERICDGHIAACLLSGLASHPEVPGGAFWVGRCTACHWRCTANCRKGQAGNDMHWPWPSRGPGGPDAAWSRCDYWNWKGGNLPNF